MTDRAGGTIRALGTAAAYREAIERIPAYQFQLLRLQYESPDFTISTRQLARQMGWKGDGNLHYGAAARNVARTMGVERRIPTYNRGGGEGIKPMYWSVFSTIETADNGEAVWKLHTPVVHAVRQLLSRGLNIESARSADIREIERRCRVKTLPKTTAERLIEARMGQGIFRDQLLDLWKGRCPVTGTTLRELLIASHSKAWSQSTDEERLDSANGVLLEARMDRLFDQYLISFEDDGTIIRSRFLSAGVLGDIRIPARARYWPAVSARQKRYLRHHRSRMAR